MGPSSPESSSLAAMTKRPLDGLLVVAVEQAVAAPLCTSRLADAGARVIKVERPGGDFARGYDSAARGDSSYFAWTNHGKESIVLDLKDDKDAGVLHCISDRADVFVQNLAPGALDRLGFASDALRARNERLITCDISGYGLSPAVAGKKAYDLLIQAESGMVGISGTPGELGRIGISIVDIGTGVTAYTGILEALLARASSGCGGGVQVSLFDVAAEWMTVPFAQQKHGQGGPERVGLRHPTIAPYGAYETSDGSLTLLSIQNEREWNRLCDDVLAEPTLATDQRFCTNSERVQNRAALEHAIASIVGALDSGTFQRRLSSASIAWGMVSSLDDLIAHPALRTRTLTSTNGGVFDLPAHPLHHRSPSEGDPTRTVPTIGEHSDAIRKEFSS